MPTANKISLRQAQLIIQELRKGDLNYGGQEGSSLRKRLNLSKGSRFTSTINTLEPLFNWITSDPRFVGSRLIQEFVHTETEHLKNSSPDLHQILAKPSNPANKKKFCWGAFMDKNAHCNPLSNERIRPSFVEQLEGYLEGRCKELFGVLSTPPPARTSNAQDTITFSLEYHSYEIRGKELIVKKIQEYFDWIVTPFNFLNSGSICVGTVLKPKFETEISLSSIQKLLYLKRWSDLDSVFKFQEFYKNFILTIEDVGKIIEFNRLKEYKYRNTREGYRCLIVICIDRENQIVANLFKEDHKQQMIIRFFDDELKSWTDKRFVKTDKENSIQFEFGKTKLKQAILKDYFGDLNLKSNKEENCEEVICIDKINWIVSRHFKEIHQQGMSVRFFDDKLKSWTDKKFVKKNKESNIQFEKTKVRQTILKDYFGTSNLKSDKEENSEEVIIKEREHSFGNTMWCLN